MRKIATYAIIATLFTATFIHTCCASTKRDVILKQLDAVSGATRKTTSR
jgi:hypothetical protein